MKRKFPQISYACPCVDINATSELPTRTEIPAEEDAEEEQPFNPHSPRANYALYPVEQLLFCTECNELRCPRCYYQEVLSYFCPRCLSERLSSDVRSESNRCPQSCHDCPVCFAPLIVNRYQSGVDESGFGNPASEKFILSCSYCSWSSLELSISFPKGVNISGQLSRLSNGGRSLDPPVNPMHSGVIDPAKEARPKRSPFETTSRFSELADFYSSQVEESTPMRDSYLAHFSSTRGPRHLHRQATKAPSQMREANTTAEGLHTHDPASEFTIIEQMKQLGWSGVTSAAQRSAQLDAPNLLSSARPIATILRTKRCKRCRTCKQQLTRTDHPRPHGKPTGFAVRSIAAKSIPRLTLQFLPLSTATDSAALKPGITLHLLARFVNPIFDAVKVTLATPPLTPGPTASRVTILCPQFNLGANPDEFESSNVVNADKSSSNTSKLSKPDVPMLAIQQPEAGKVWEKGKNWTTVVVEVVPGMVRDYSDHKGDAEEQEDARILRIPVFVRLEYTIEGKDRLGLVAEKAGDDGKMTREVAYWCVLDIGRIVAVG